MLKSHVKRKAKESGEKNSDKVAKTKIIVKRKQYSEESLNKALNLARRGKSLRITSKMCGVPVSTINRKLKNTDLNSKSGPPTVFNKNIEKDIVTWVKQRAEMGVPVTKSQLLDAVQLYTKFLKLENPFTNGRPGRHWYEAFMKRNPDVSMRTPQNLPASRLVTQEDLKQWFLEIKTYLQSHNLLNIDSSRVFNCDESSMNLCPKSDKVLCEKGARSVYKVVNNGEKECISALFMYSANGNRAPPMVIHKYKDNHRVPDSIAKNCPKDWAIGISESGWMTTEVFYEYMVNVFYKWLVRSRIEFPVVVYFDGHSSHMTLPLVTFCKEKNIELIALYPMSTHIIQPLDVAFFHPMKNVWKIQLTQWLSDNELEKVAKDQVAIILKKTLDSMKEEKNIIINGFKTCGLVLFDPSQVNYDFLKKKKKTVKKPPSEAVDNVSSNMQVNFDDSNKSSAEYFLLQLEMDLEPALKEKFSLCGVTGIWNGEEKHKGLFEYWLSKKQFLDNRNSEKLSDKVCIKSLKNVNNLKITVLKESPPENMQLKSNTDMCQPELMEQDILMSSNQSSSNFEYSIEDLDIIIDTSTYNNNDQLSRGSTFDFIPNDNTMESLEIVSGPASLTSVDSTLKEVINTEIAEFHYIDDKLQKKRIDISQNLEFSAVEESILDLAMPKQNDLAEKFGNICKPIDNSDKENSMPTNENCNKRSQPTDFSQAFTLPENFLPKKKRQKLSKTGKSKLPSVGTSDDWIAAKLKVEEKKKIKEQKTAEKKRLQEEKKELALKMKNITEKIKATNQKIKKEKV